MEVDDAEIQYLSDFSENDLRVSEDQVRGGILEIQAKSNAIKKH